MTELTKREQVAMEILKALITSDGLSWRHGDVIAITVIPTSYKIADAFLAHSKEVSNE